jgi:hypothetical protein
MLFNKKLTVLEFLIGLALTVYAVWFNLDLYRLEPTATTDPNDNNFQFALVDRANQVWDYASRECKKQVFIFRPLCHLSIMSDHWVPNWAEGYNLPFYYSHMPQTVIVGSYRFINSAAQIFHKPFMSLFQYYHLIIYLLLCFFPISVFFAVRIIGLPWIIAGAGAIFATHLSTDGLYGFDPPSFLWRGWGLSSQLFAMIWYPLATAYSFRFLRDRDIPEEINFDDTENFLPELPKSVTGIKTVDDVIHFSYRVAKMPSFWMAVMFDSFAVMGHLGLGAMILMSAGALTLAYPLELLLRQERLSLVWEETIATFVRFFYLVAAIFFFLGYWIIPTLLYGNFHNISVWDPIWKFDSYGWKETLIRLFNGDLLDFGRFPVLTLLTFAGLFIPAYLKFNHKKVSPETQSVANKEQFRSPAKVQSNHLTVENCYFPFSFLFLFWLLFYFGRTTWGGLIDLFPSMKEFHQSRFIIGLHAASLFLIPISILWISDTIRQIISKFLLTRKQAGNKIIFGVFSAVIILLMLAIMSPPIYRQSENYNELNNRLIIQANGNAAKVQNDFNALLTELYSRPAARVFAGRGGGWGKNFKIAETEMFMYLSDYHIPTVLWLPETWSPNSDTEQYFSDTLERDYDLYNLHYVAAPPDVTPQKFWQEVKRNPSWVLYEVPTSGYFTVGKRTMTVVSDKQSLLNIVRLWIQSPIPSQKLFPEISFTRPRGDAAYQVPVIRMTDEANYLTELGMRRLPGAG